MLLHNDFKYFYIFLFVLGVFRRFGLFGVIFVFNIANYFVVIVINIDDDNDCDNDDGCSDTAAPIVVVAVGGGVGDEDGAVCDGMMNDQYHQIKDFHICNVHDFFARRIEMGGGGGRGAELLSIF